MSFLNIVSELVAGNIGFILQLFLDHPFWVFGFAVVAVLLRSKSAIGGFVILVIYIYIQVDIAVLYGWNFIMVPAMFLFVHITLITLTDGYKFLGKYSEHGATILFFFMMLAHNSLGLF
ncbi:MAG: hypothetical protein COV47_04775 [Candidatus Diapherotrites archaeon CG11_big_fil_rev_8_21_14_0_20_37_9]|nr:MAG: hypothetical protein COV47_04775 [Candidatus Diapherotrites archaeon CG11_big_fil_rev_8_21_14_0_20_37_9]